MPDSLKNCGKVVVVLFATMREQDGRMPLAYAVNIEEPILRFRKSDVVSKKGIVDYICSSALDP